MNTFLSSRKTILLSVIVLALSYLSPLDIFAQDEAPMPSAFDDTTTSNIDTTKGKSNPSVQKGYENMTAGEFTPAKGFDIFKSDIVSLNLSFYGLVRYINQTPGEQNFTDHLGNVRTVSARNDIEWQRSFIWLTGFFYDKRFRYNVSIWSLGSTQQTLVFGQLMYQFSKAFTLGAGIGPNLGVRSMQGSWPFWLSSDRQMGEEFVRPGFTNTAFITGEALSRFYYKVSVGNNISQLSIKAANDARDFTYGASLWWMPTTGEFGPRGGFGDLENHEEVATRFGVSATFTRDDRGNPVSDSIPFETQLRLSDGVYVYERGALAPGVTLQKADYAIIAFDAGLKYRGFNLQVEYYMRSLSNFLATGPLPDDKIIDNALSIYATYMIVPSYLDIHGSTSLVFDQFERKPWEVSGGLSYYPSGTRSWRVNLHVNKIDKSPTGSTFGFYAAGQTGTTYSIGADILL